MLGSGGYGLGPLTRDALVLAPLRHTFEELGDALRARGSTEVARAGDAWRWRGAGVDLRIDVAEDAGDACARLGTRYYHVVVVDCRHLPHRAADAETQETVLRDFLDRLGAERSRERRFPFDRIVVLVGDRDEERVDRLIFELGRRHVGACLRDLALSTRSEAPEDAVRERFLGQLWSFLRRAIVERRSGRKAISCAGGGITGIFYELGVLKCLSDALEVDIRDFDLYFGISAGALVTGCLANGIHVDEMLANLGASNGEWPRPFHLRWHDLNFREIPSRLLTAQRDVAAWLLSAVRRRSQRSMSAALGPYDALVPPFFDGTALGGFLHELFTAEGRTDDFRRLRRELYVGATDQDSREHVLFGEPGQDHVPISLAIQASTAANPFFKSVEIEGRRYTDGILTRTSNLTAAIEKGADLVFVIDPFVPLIADEPGFNAKHGSLWLVEQDIKTLSYTRFDQVSDEILRRNPHVSAYTFVPSRRMRRLLSQNPFASSNFDTIVCEAYASTYRRLRDLEAKIRGELFAHGIQLELDPVGTMVRSLAESERASALTLIGPDQVLKRPRCRLETRPTNDRARAVPAAAGGG